LYTDLVNGRWFLSEEVFLELRQTLEKRLGYLTPTTGDTHYVRQFQIARLVKENLKYTEGVEPGSIHAQSFFMTEGGDTQIYFTALPENNENRILVITVDTEWVSNVLFEQCRTDMNSHIKAVSDFHIQPVAAPGNPELRIPFENVYSFLELRLPEGSVASGQFAFKVQLVIIGLTAVITLSLLVIIMVLIVRITRERIAIAMRSDFLSHVSHELKTPLTLIQLYVETLLTDENLPEEDRHYSLEVISKESTNLLNLIENLLQLSGTEKSPELYKMSEGDLAALIEKTTHVCTEWLNKRGLTLQTRIATGIPYLNFDSEKVTRAFLNLIDNAMKYSGDSGSIDVRLWSEQDKVVLEVQDHGPGIPESEQKNIFDQFYRGSAASDSRGVGLGLYLVSQTMKAHDGSVELHSEAGKGSTFRLIFPIHKTETASSKI
jgi:signal transduction histidine kinase